MDQEKILKPDHYHRNKIDVIGFLEQHFPESPSVTVADGFKIGNVIKYVCRAGNKNGLEDLIKARNYLNMMIKDAEKKQKQEQNYIMDQLRILVQSGKISLDEIEKLKR